MMLTAGPRASASWLCAAMHCAVKLAGSSASDCALERWNLSESLAYDVDTCVWNAVMPWTLPKLPLNCLGGYMAATAVHARALLQLLSLTFQGCKGGCNIWGRYAA